MQKLRQYFFSGLVVFLPVVLTVYLFIFAVNSADSLIGKFLQPYLSERYFRGLGLLIAMFSILLTGFFVTNYLGKKIFAFFEKLFLKLPFFKQVYPALKEMASFLFSREKLKSFRSVILVEYPRKGVYSLGFLTNETTPLVSNKVGKDLCNVFIPSSPGPITGYVILVPKKDIVSLDISVEEAFKLIVSGGVVNPH